MAEAIFDENNLCLSHNSDVGNAVKTSLYSIDWIINTYTEEANFGRSESDLYIGSISSTNHLFYRRLYFTNKVKVIQMYQYGLTNQFEFSGFTMVLSNIVCVEDAAYCMMGKTIGTSYSGMRMMATSPWTQEDRSGMSYRISWINFQKGTTLMIGGAEDASKGVLLFDYSVSSGSQQVSSSLAD